MAADDAAELATKLFAHAAAKGGQEGIDRSKINAIVMSLTKSSAFTKEKLEHEAEAASWAEEARRKLATFDATQRSAAAYRVRTAKFPPVWRGWCCVVDFDMFFAAVEIRDRPDLAAKPVAVGGLGMISTANYVARKWGVRSAMPGWIGRELCRRGPEFGMPSAELVFVKPNYEKYARVAEVARGIIKEYDPDYRSYSLDEAYIELSCRSKAEAEDAVRSLRSRVREATGLTMSAGIGPNFLLAKIAADVHKPNGQFCVDSVDAFLEELPCRRAPGVGRVLDQKLREGLGVETIGDLRRKLPEVYRVFPEKTQYFLHRIALGIENATEDDRDARQQKGVGHERTFGATACREELRETLAGLCGAVADRLVANGLVPTKCSLKLKRDDFRVAVRTVDVASAANLRDVLEPVLEAELQANPQPLRLLGVRATNFKEAFTADQRTVDAFFKKKSTKRPREQEHEDPDDDHALAQLVDMGFDSHVALKALREHHFRLSAALDDLTRRTST